MKSKYQEMFPEVYAHVNHYKPQFKRRYQGSTLLFSALIDKQNTRGRYFNFHEIDSKDSSTSLHEDDPETENREGIFESGVYELKSPSSPFFDDQPQNQIVLLPEDKSWRVTKAYFSYLCSITPEEYLNFQTYAMGEQQPSNPGPFPELSLENLRKDVRDYICEHTGYDFFWSLDSSPQYYRLQAKLGFIAISSQGRYKNYLFPQLQQAYAVLFWDNLRFDSHVKSKLRKHLTRQLPLSFEVTREIDEVLEQLQLIRGPSSWLSEMYVSLLLRTHSPEEQKNEPSFSFWATILRWNGKPVAGELGYTIGSTYTSLSGFFHREVREWNHLGKLQLVLLAQHLETCGIDFWNLGHPHMNYKKALGAKVLPRSEFLPLWDSAVQKPPIDITSTSKLLFSDKDCQKE